jgi:hypothetical protein
MINEEENPYAFLDELEGYSQEIVDYYEESNNQVEMTPYIDLFFPFIIS